MEQSKTDTPKVSLSTPIVETPEVSPTTPVVEEKKVIDKGAPTQPKKKGVSSWLVVVVVILALSFLGIVGYIVYTNVINPIPVLTEDENTTDTEEDGNTEDTTEDDGVCTVGEDDCADDEEEEASTTEFEGEVISATLPVGWSIVEYFDGDGTTSLPEGMDYLGLTALDIVTPDNRQVFTLQAVSGIGFAGCPEYAIFDDNGEAYMFEQETASTEMGETLNTVDLTGEDYEEFEFLNTTFRRIDRDYWYDTQEGNNYFEPPCVNGLLTLEGLYFTDTDGYKYEAYFYGATEDSTEEDLLIVDTILESMEVI